MEINGDDKLEGVRYVNAGTIQRIMVPRLLVIHYTVTRTMRSVVDFFAQQNAPASAHLVIDRDGSMTQMVPFDRTAAHAGKSSWSGVESCNRYSVGFELVNMGPLNRGSDGILRDVYGKPIDTEVFDEGRKLWENYPQAQIDATVEAARTVCEQYGITEIVGHSDISPGRKIDPGPAFPMTYFRRAVLGV